MGWNLDAFDLFELLLLPSVSDLILALTIYVLLGWLDEGSNEFGEKFLLFQVFVKIFFYIWDIFDVENVENVEINMRKSKKEPKFIIAKIQPA